MDAELIPASGDRERCAALYRALGEERRLAMVEALLVSDRTPSELGEVTGLPSNLLAHHLDVLEGVGLIARRRSQGDRRRRYVTLTGGWVEPLVPDVEVPGRRVLFLCTRNAARSQMAAALWQARTGRPGLSAGREPAERVDPLAVRVARAHGLDLSGARPRGYREVGADPDLVVSVCDRAREAGIPFQAAHLHWSVADPAGGEQEDFEAAYRDIAGRIDRLARRAVA